MNNKNKQICIIIGVIIVGYLLINYSQKFAISDTDFVLDGPVTLLPAYAITGTTIANFSWAESAGVNYTMLNQTVFYIIGNDTTIYFTIPTLEGTNTINRFMIGINDDGTTATLTKWHTVYTKEIQVQNVSSEQICTAVNGTYSNLTCTCQDKTKWTDNSTRKVCPPLILNVEKEIEVQSGLFEKYGLSIIILVMSAIIILIIYRRRRK